MTDTLALVSITEIYELAIGLRSTTHRYGSSYLVRCPSHDHPDVRPSCLLTPSSGRWRCLSGNCRAQGGKLDLIVAAKIASTKHAAMLWLKNALPHTFIQEQPGLQRRDKHPDERLVGDYAFCELEHDVAYRILRYEHATGKRFEFLRPDGGGNWIPHYTRSCNRPHCACHGTGPLAQQSPRLIPYRLPELRDAIAAGRTVFVVEGEKHVDALHALDFVATTNAFGASWTWPTHWQQFFHGARRIIVLPDADDAGCAWTQHLTLPKKSVHVMSLFPPDVHDGSDIIDWLQHHSADDLKELCRTTLAPTKDA